MTDPDAVDDTLLQKSREAIDEARQAAKKVAETEDIEAGDLPAFADSTPGVDTGNAFSGGEQAEATDDATDAEDQTEPAVEPVDDSDDSSVDSSDDEHAGE